MDGQKKNAWWRRPAGWICAFVGMLGIQAAAYLLCELGSWVIDFLNGLSTVAVVLLVLMGGSVFCGLFLYSVALIPQMVVNLSNSVSKSRRGTRYYVIGIYTLIGCAIMIYAGIKGAVRGGSMLWYYIRFGYIALASVLMIAAGREQAEPDEQAEKRANPKWWKVLLVVIVAAAALYGAWYFGVQYGAAAKPEVVTAQIEEAVQNAKNEAKQEQRAKDLKELVHNRSSASIAYSVKKAYGINPEEAYAIVEAYNENGNHGGDSWDEYQNALGAVLYTANLFAEK